MHTHSRRLLAVGLAAALALGSTIINPIAVNAKDKDSNAQITVPIGAAVSGINPATGQALSAGRSRGRRQSRVSRPRDRNWSRAAPSPASSRTAVRS